MSDYSLMNSDHLKSEIHDLETKLIPGGKELETELKMAIERIYGYIEDTEYNNGGSATLTHDQVSDLIRTLSKVKLNTFRYTNMFEFNLKVYKQLLKDRSWFIAAKYLRFLRK